MAAKKTKATRVDPGIRADTWHHDRNAFGTGTDPCLRPCSSIPFA